MKYSAIALSALFLSLTACSDKGGDSDNDSLIDLSYTPDPVYVDPIKITPENQTEVIQSAVVKLKNGQATPFPVNSDSSSVHYVTAEHNVLNNDWVKNQYQRALNQRDSFTGVTITEACEVSGSVTIASDIEPENYEYDFDAYAEEGTISTTFHDCDEGDNILMNGTVIMSLSDVVETDTSYGMKMKFIYKQFTQDFLTSSVQSFQSLDGDLTLNIESTDNFLSNVTSYSSDQLTTTTVTGEITTLTLLDMSNTITFNFNSDEISSSLSATYVESNAIDSDLSENSFTITTVQALDVSTLGDDIPSQGEFIISGNNSNITIMVIDEYEVLVASDYDGDGVIDDSFTTDWVSLYSLN